MTSELNIKNTELLRMDKIKDEFLANTSHELKTPLHGIIGLADSIYNNLSNYEQKKIKNDLSLIAASSRRLANLINDILDYSRLKYNDLAMQIKPVHLKSTVDNVLEISS